MSTEADQVHMRIPSCRDGTIIAVFDDAPGHPDAQSALPVCVPKALAASVFELHNGDAITLTGGAWDIMGTGVVWGLRADNIARRTP